MKITNILSLANIRTGVTAASKEELINFVVDLAAQNDKVLDRERMRQAIFEREKIMSTGVGSGFALPHGKTDAVSDVVGAFIVTKDEIDYQSLDGQPVRLVFLLVGKENMVGPHIKLISRISRMMNKEEFRTKLLTAATPDEVLELFRQEESNYSDV